MTMTNPTLLFQLVSISSKIKCKLVAISLLLICHRCHEVSSFSPVSPSSPILSGATLNRSFQSPPSSSPSMGTSNKSGCSTVSKSGIKGTPPNKFFFPLAVYIGDNNEANSNKSEVSLPKTSDPYIILNIKNRQATQDQIKRAYRKAALLFHPDVRINPDSTQEDRHKAHEDFAKINDAYSFLAGKGDYKPGSPARHHRYYQQQQSYYQQHTAPTTRVHTTRSSEVDANVAEDVQYGNYGGTQFGNYGGTTRDANSSKTFSDRVDAGIHDTQPYPHPGNHPHHYSPHHHRQPRPPGSGTTWHHDNLHTNPNFKPKKQTFNSLPNQNNDPQSRKNRGDFFDADNFHSKWNANNNHDVHAPEQSWTESGNYYKGSYTRRGDFSNPEDFHSKWNSDNSMFTAKNKNGSHPNHNIHGKNPKWSSSLLDSDKFHSKWNANSLNAEDEKTTINVKKTNSEFLHVHENPVQSYSDMAPYGANVPSNEHSKAQAQSVRHGNIQANGHANGKVNAFGHGFAQANGRANGKVNAIGHGTPQANGLANGKVNAIGSLNSPTNQYNKPSYERVQHIGAHNGKAVTNNASHHQQPLMTSAHKVQKETHIPQRVNIQHQPYRPNDNVNPKRYGDFSNSEDFHERWSVNSDLSTRKVNGSTTPVSNTPHVRVNKFTKPTNGQVKNSNHPFNSAQGHVNSHKPNATTATYRQNIQHQEVHDHRYGDFSNSQDFHTKWNGQKVTYDFKRSGDFSNSEDFHSKWNSNNGSFSLSDGRKERKASNLQNGSTAFKQERRLRSAPRPKNVADDRRRRGDFFDADQFHTRFNPENCCEKIKAEEEERKRKQAIIDAANKRSEQTATELESKEGTQSSIPPSAEEGTTSTMPSSAAENWDIHVHTSTNDKDSIKATFQDSIKQTVEKTTNINDAKKKWETYGYQISNKPNQTSYPTYAWDIARKDIE